MRGRWTLASGVPLRWLALVLLVLLALVLVVLLVLVVVVLALGGGHTGSSGDFTPLHFPPPVLLCLVTITNANNHPSPLIGLRPVERVTGGQCLFSRLTRNLFKAFIRFLWETCATPPLTKWGLKSRYLGFDFKQSFHCFVLCPPGSVAQAVYCTAPSTMLAVAKMIY